MALAPAPFGRPAISSSQSIKPFVWPSRVYYEDTDMSGVVYHANYLKFFERARTEWLRCFGFDQENLRREHRLVFALRRLELDFIRAARLDDMLEISVVPALLKQVYFVLEQEASIGGEPIARAKVQVVCLDHPAFTPRVVPDFIKRKIQE